MTTSIFDVSSIWPDAYLHGNRKSRVGNDLEERFGSGGRYRMDFSDAFRHDGWYQFDTAQDASYYGNWCNPTTLMILSYTEGDIYLVRCADVAAYQAELDAMANFDARYLGITPEQWRQQGYGIDDRDGHYGERLSQRTGGE